MYTSVDLSALRGKKPFTGRSGGQAHLPDRWTILLGVSYLLGILLGTKAMELAPENLQSGMLTIFSEYLAARTSQTLQQAVLSAFWHCHCSRRYCCSRGWDMVFRYLPCWNILHRMAFLLSWECCSWRRLSCAAL